VGVLVGVGVGVLLDGVIVGVGVLVAVLLGVDVLVGVLLCISYFITAEYGAILNKEYSNRVLKYWSAAILFSCGFYFLWSGYKDNNY
jgi:uncharacterized membrane protein YfcA